MFCASLRHKDPLQSNQLQNITKTRQPQKTHPRAKSRNSIGEHGSRYLQYRAECETLDIGYLEAGGPELLGVLL